MKTPATRGSDKIEESFQKITQALGGCVELDAARVGSFAHRLRDFWTNLADAEQMQAVFEKVERDPALHLGMILGEGRRQQICVRSDQAPWYQVNKAGERIRVLPTLVAYLGPEGGSYAFRDGGPGMVFSKEGHLVPLSIEERELALGYQAGDTAGLQVSEYERHLATGRCMDANTVSSLFAVGIALRLSAQQQVDIGCVSLSTVAADSFSQGEALSPGSTGVWGVNATTWTPRYEGRGGSLPSVSQSAAAVSEAEEATLSPQQVGREGACDGRDIWEDALTLGYIQAGKIDEVKWAQLNQKERARIIKRARSYKWETGTAGVLSRFLSPLVGWKVVPPPAERRGLVEGLHQSCGHFGRRRTVHLVLLHYWWPGLYSTVRDVVRACEQCQRIRAIFNSQRPDLQSLPIMGMFYRWHVDLFGPCPPSARGNTYVMVAIEAFSKHCELIPMTNKSAAETAFHFHHNVLGRFGACAEVVTDQGNEFQGEFASLLAEALIEHRHTSAHHPQANGLAERCVQTVKRCLKKLIESEAECQKWDLLLPWVALGYRCTPQEATKLAPYQLLYAQMPMIPSVVREEMSQSLDLDDPEQAADQLLKRSRLLAKLVFTAGQNLLIAQQRDSLRYARVHDGSYLRQTRRFSVGDYVYTKSAIDDTAPSSFRALANPEVLRVREVRPSGVLVLEGRDGQRVEDNVLNCAPCHLHISDPGVDWASFRPPKDYPCRICYHPDQEDKMLICDRCHDGYHMFCLSPPLSRVPKGLWFCPACTASQQGTAPGRKGEPSKSGEGVQSAQGQLPRPQARAPAVSRGIATRRSTRLGGMENTVAGLVCRYLGSENGRLLSGQWVLRNEALPGGERRPRIGQLRALPSAEQGKANVAYEVQYQGGGHEVVTPWQAWVSLLPACQQAAPQPQPDQATTLVSSLSRTLPDTWDLGHTPTVRRALSALSPGQWSDAEVQRVQVAIKEWGQGRQVSGAPGIGLSPCLGRVPALLRAVDLRSAASILDISVDQQHQLEKEFRVWGIRIVSLKGAPQGEGAHAANPLQPVSYASPGLGSVQVIVMGAPPGVLEILLPLAARSDSQLVCCQVPSGWSSRVPAPLRTWLQHLHLQGRLRVIRGPPSHNDASWAEWIVIFRSRLARARFSLRDPRPDFSPRYLEQWV